MSFLKSYYLIFLAFISITLLHWERFAGQQQALTPSLAVGLYKITAVVLIAVLLFLTIIYLVSLGRLCRRVLKLREDSLLLDTAIGFAATTYLVAVLGHLKILYMPITVGVLLAVLAVGAADVKRVYAKLKHLIASIWQESQFTTLAAILLFVYVLFKWSNTLILQGHVDPLYYHLPSAWLWSKAHAIYYIEWLPWTLQGGVGEYFYTYLAQLVGERFILMALAQSSHFYFGYVATALVVYKIARQSIPTNRAEAAGVLAALAYVTFTEEAMMLVRAKNDGFLVFFEMLTLYYGLNYLKHRSKSAFMFSICFSYFAISIKLTAAFFVLPFWFLMFLFTGMDWQRLRVAVFALPIALPVFMRNYAFTQNPFFPAYNTLFPSPYMSSYLELQIANFSRVNGSLFEILQSQGSRFIWSKISYCVGLFACFDKNRERRFVAALALLALVLYGLVTGQGLYARFMFFVFACLSICAVGVFYGVIVAPFKVIGRWLSIAQLCFLATILIGSQYEVPYAYFYKRVMPFVLSEDSFAIAFAQNKPSYRLHRWINENLPNAKIFSIYDNENYFLDVPLSVAENQKEASEVIQAQSYDEALRVLKTHGFTHLQTYHEAAGLFPFMKDPKFSGDFKLIKQEKNYEIYQILL